MVAGWLFGWVYLDLVRLVFSLSPTLAVWDTYIYPDDKELIRTSDDQEMSYRIAPNPYHAAQVQ